MAVKCLDKGKWQIDFRHHGRRIIRVVRAESNAQAEGIIAKCKYAEAENRYLDVKKEQNITLQEYAERYLEYSKAHKRESSYFRDTHSVNQLKKVLTVEYQELTKNRLRSIFRKD